MASDFQLEDDQTVDSALVVLDGVGNLIAGADLDAGSVTATAADASVIAASVSPDGSTLTTAAVGPLGTGEVVDIAGSLNGVPLTGQFVIDVVDSAPATIGVVPGEPTTIVAAPPADNPPAEAPPAT